MELDREWISGLRMSYFTDVDEVNALLILAKLGSLTAAILYAINVWYICSAIWNSYAIYAINVISILPYVMN